MRQWCLPPGLCLVLILGSVAPAVGQQTRVEAIAEAQAAKAEALEPEEPSNTERFIERVMRSPLLAGSGGFFPWFGSLYSGTGFAVGVGYLQRGARRSRVTMTGAQAFNGSRGFDASWHLPTPTLSGNIRPRIDANLSNITGITTYGVGPDASTERTTFDYRPREVYGALEVIAAPLTLTGRLGYLGFSTIGNAGATGHLPALNTSLDYTVAALEATLDSRHPSARYSTGGGFVRGAWNNFSARSSTYSFGRLEFESAYLVPFYREQFGLAFRALATTTRTDDDNEVPFLLLPYVGSGNTVRSLPHRRLHDRSRVVLTAEYRWRPSRYVDMALFVDSGAVARSLATLRSDRLETGYGMGIRFHGPEFTALRIDVARGSDGMRLVFSGGLPF